MRDPIARYPISGTADKSVNLPERASYLVLYNDGSSNVTVTVGKSFSVTIAPGDFFDERLDPFDRIKITATSPYRGYVRVPEGGNL
ncbi:hypothetical protein [Paenibacillus wulumuqiensis]|uniref:hypothetical protein n=1 Tax=Paenibacillus wulumuqiensis TaxID=1567107 RepID=UPI0006190CAF|nr:hypothetical protein [Paenibacillus wulumuqiensis]